MNSRRTTLIVAVVLALGTGWMTLNYLSAVRSSASSEQRYVMVAVSDIPARGPIAASMVKRVQRPSSAVEPDALADDTALNGAYALISIPAGGVITSSKISTSAEGALPVRLSPGKRALSIQVDKVKSVSGLIQPGDLVDVISIPPKTGSQPPPAATILRGIRVLAVGTSLETTSATPSPEEQTSTTVTLEVSPSQADLLAMADQNTSLRLALRSPRESLSSEPTEALHFPDDDNQPAAAPQEPVAAPVERIMVAPPARREPARSGIMMINGDAISFVPR